VNLIFICTGNSCRSILAEATCRHLAPPNWRVMSAGSHPAGFVHPKALALLAREGISADGCTSTSWDDLPVAPDVVITVCDSAAGEACPAYLAPAIPVHWGVADPARVTGSDATINAAFEEAYRILRARIEAMLALPELVLSGGRERLEAALRRIGNLAR